MVATLSGTESPQLPHELFSSRNLCNRAGFARRLGRTDSFERDATLAYGDVNRAVSNIDRERRAQSANTAAAGRYSEGHFLVILDSKMSFSPKQVDITITPHRN